MGIYYTIQTIEAFDELLDRGTLCGKEEWATPEFKDAYGWMTKQMLKRLGKAPDRPMWLWPKRPDLRYSAHLPRGTKGVLLEIELPDADVLLSDFDAWHCVLNDVYLPWDEADDEQNRQADRAAKEQSWERIFDWDKLLETEYWGSPEPRLQCVTGPVSFKSIRQTTFFTAA